MGNICNGNTETSAIEEELRKRKLEMQKEIKLLLLGILKHLFFHFLIFSQRKWREW